MQVSNNIIDQHHGMPLQAVFSKGGKTHIENEKLSDINRTELLNSSQKRNYKTYESQVFLKGIQNEYLEIQKVDSYLGKLQKVLEKFREYSKKIAQDALNDNVISQSDNKSTRDDAQSIEQIIKEFPMLKEVNVEAGNFKIKNLIGTTDFNDIFIKFGKDLTNQNDKVNHELIGKRETLEKLNHMLSKVDGRRSELKNHLDKIEKVVTVGQNIENKIFGITNNIPSTIHKNLAANKAIELLA
ncbi:MAG: hypothetical protein OEV44_06520 [Spirochaetota bacterium]|nr:hypothetical protein [Spirochaetota bacterium]